MIGSLNVTTAPLSVSRVRHYGNAIVQKSYKPPANLNLVDSQGNVESVTYRKHALLQIVVRIHVGEPDRVLTSQSVSPVERQFLPTPIFIERVSRGGRLSRLQWRLQFGNELDTLSGGAG